MYVFTIFYYTLCKLLSVGPTCRVPVIAEATEDTRDLLAY